MPVDTSLIESLVQASPLIGPVLVIVLGFGLIMVWMLFRFLKTIGAECHKSQDRGSDALSQTAVAMGEMKESNNAVCGVMDQVRILLIRMNGKTQ